MCSRTWGTHLLITNRSPRILCRDSKQICRLSTTHILEVPRSTDSYGAASALTCISGPQGATTSRGGLLGRNVDESNRSGGRGPWRMVYDTIKRSANGLCLGRRSIRGGDGRYLLVYRRRSQGLHEFCCGWPWRGGR